MLKCLQLQSDHYWKSEWNYYDFKLGCFYKRGKNEMLILCHFAKINTICRLFEREISVSMSD